MHVLERMKVLHSLANISKVSFYFRLGQLTITKLNLIVETSTFSELQDHVGHVFILFIVVIDEFDDVGVVEFVMDIDFLFGIPSMDLHDDGVTILMATISPVSLFLASFTSPYDPNPTMLTLLFGPLMNS